MHSKRPLTFYGDRVTTSTMSTTDKLELHKHDCKKGCIELSQGQWLLCEQGRQIEAEALREGAINKTSVRGSRLQCLMLTALPRPQVASILTRMIEPIGSVQANDVWAPCGFLESDEAKLGEHPSFLSPQERETLTSWWLKKREYANTPNWDLVSTCDISGTRGLILVEAKAHDNELKDSGKDPGNSDNDSQITQAIAEANSALNRILPGWALTKDSHYQLCNRFAWAWKISTMGTPVVLVYLGFLRCDEMSDCGAPFDSAQHWKETMLGHSQSLVPVNAWENRLRTTGAPLWALIRTLDAGWNVG